MTKPAQSCPVCGKRTKGKNSLKAHLRDNHPDECAEAAVMAIAEEVVREMREGA